jgi:hypothetical protein
MDASLLLSRLHQTGIRYQPDGATAAAGRAT